MITGRPIEDHSTIKKSDQINELSIELMDSNQKESNENQQSNRDARRLKNHNKRNRTISMYDNQSKYRKMNQTDLEMLKWMQRNRTMILMNRLINKFNSTDKRMIRLLKRNQTRLIEKLTNFLNQTQLTNQTQMKAFRKKFNQTNLRQLFEFDKQMNKTLDKLNHSRRGRMNAITDNGDNDSKLSDKTLDQKSDKLSNILMNNITNDDQLVSTTNYSTANDLKPIHLNATTIANDKRNSLEINKCPIKCSKFRPSHSVFNSSIESSKTTDLVCNHCDETMAISFVNRNPIQTTTQSSISSSKQQQRQITNTNQMKVINKDQQSITNMTIDFDLNLRSTNRSNNNLNFKSNLKKSKLVGSKVLAQQNMQPTNQNQPMPTQTNNQPNQLNAIFPTCTLLGEFRSVFQDEMNSIFYSFFFLDLFCWCYRYTRFMFVYSY